MNFRMLAQSMRVKKESVGSVEDVSRVLKDAIDSGKPPVVKVFIENNPLTQYFLMTNDTPKKVQELIT